MSQARRTSTYRPPAPAELGRAGERPRRSGVVPKRASAPPVAVPRAPRTPKVAAARATVPPAKVALASIPLHQRAPAGSRGGVAEVIELRRRPSRPAPPPEQPAVVVQGCIWLLGPSPDEEQDAPLPLVRIS